MARIIKVPEAQADLKQVVEYIVADNLPATLRWLEDVEAIFALLATQPLMGQELRTKSLGKVRRHTFGRYSIYYVPIADGIEVLKIVHGARDQERIV
jgi:toxin ParE1/3/4